MANQSNGNAGARRRLALITGASSGIGDRLSRQFAAGGFDLVLVARREDKLKALGEELAKAHGIAAHVLAADLADPDAPRTILARLGEMGLQADALVNNAGFANHGRFAEIPEKAELDLIQVNVAAVVHLTRLLLPGMLARAKGWVLNVASTAAFAPGPGMATYYASKAFVLSFSEAVADEVSGTGVVVTALCPGPTETGFADAAGIGSTPLFRSGAMDADAVARAGYDGLMRGCRIVIPGLKNRLLALTGRLSPEWIKLQIARRLNGEPG